jgi:hypothetical protein
MESISALFTINLSEILKEWKILVLVWNNAHVGYYDHATDLLLYQMSLSANVATVTTVRNMWT